MEDNNHVQTNPTLGPSLSTYIGLREKTETTAKNAMNDNLKKFKNNQGLFSGEKKTFAAFDGFADEDTKRGYRKVASNVKSQLEYMNEILLNYLEVALSVEKTNASGEVTADLIVEGVSWGVYSSLELLRMRSFLETTKLKDIYSNLPTRSLTEIWELTVDSDYSDMTNIYCTPVATSNTKTTIKEDMILLDPHPDKSRQPIVTTKTNQVNTGTATVQKFSGELNIAQVAELQSKLDKLHIAVIKALGRANAVTVQKSTLGPKIFEYLHSGL